MNEVFDPANFTLDNLMEYQEEIKEGVIIYGEKPAGDLHIDNMEINSCPLGTFEITETLMRVSIESPYGNYWGQIHLFLLIGKFGKCLLNSMWYDIPEEEVYKEQQKQDS